MSARSPLICSAVELWYKKMLKIGSLSELTGIDTKIKVAGFQRLYSKWLWLLMAVYKPSFADAEIDFEPQIKEAYREFVERLIFYLDSETDNMKRIRTLNLIHVEIETVKSLEVSYGAKKDVLKIVYSDKVLSFVQKNWS